MLAGVASLSSTGFILAMTFERFYSIIRPHKTASFNTFKRAQITIACIILLSILFDVPHVFMTLKVCKNLNPIWIWRQCRQTVLLLALSGGKFLPTFRVTVDHE